MFAHANNQILSACCGAQTFCRCHKITPAVFQRTTTACRFWQGYLAGRGVTQYCHSVVLHQFHWVDSDGLLPLIGCWAVITTSNNDRYFKDSRESKNKENWQWFLFFLGILLSIFWYFLTMQLWFFFCVMLSSQSKFFMMPGFSYVRRHFSL